MNLRIRYLASALLLFALPGCAGGPPSVEEAALAEFKAWVAASAEGKAEESFQGLSDSYASEWLFEMSAGNDRIFRDWRGGLTGTVRTDLDIWIEHCKKTRARTGRADRAPGTVLQHPALVALWKSYFAVNAKAVALQMSRLEVLKAYGDDTGVTIAVRGVSQKTELYGLVYDRGGWKIDNYRQPNQSVQTQ
jgi:hypothetical protein